MGNAAYSPLLLVVCLGTLKLSVVKLFQYGSRNSNSLRMYIVADGLLPELRGYLESTP